MKKIFRRLLGVILCSGIACNAAPLADNQETVPSQGVTDIAAMFGKSRISVKITTHEVDIGKPGDDWPKKKLTSCTYSRIPCSLVDYLEVFVNGNAVPVDRSVYADLADVLVAGLRQKKNGQFLLTLRGGDASESYTVDVVFDKNSIRQRELKSNLDGRVLQRTTYFVPPAID